ncbi:hypothetical protein [Massilia sp. Root335]|uniref:hypothetical protein n=1 Tax=Massilia sp. Root335 TaxID=1736517 RepID=UPI0006F3116E|nr:hypothetical protein [Massilia sp. Root335]KQV49883.1 hypothetical protein ASC93_10115 [Massilia sp. Root335]
MPNRFVSFLQLARWTSVVVTLMYHVRFLLFVDYEDVHAKTALSAAFYFLTGLGHESFAVFFVLDGIVTGRVLLRRPPGAAVARRVGALYRLLLPGLVLGAAFDAAGARFFNGSGLYTAYPAFSTLTLGSAPLLGNLLMLQPFVVPTFGSNGMLYLLSYLFWSLILLALCARAAWPRRIVLLAVVVALAPASFLAWAAIWLAGIAVVYAGATHAARPPAPVAIAGFAGALLLSRFIGADAHLLPSPFGAWLIEWKYLFVGVGFAAVAWALYPPHPRHDVTGDHAAPQAAAFTFFFHFPVMMLLVAVASTFLGQPLMQQPAAARYGEFVILVAACVGMTVLAVRAGASAMDAVAGRRPRIAA